MQLMPTRGHPDDVQGTGHHVLGDYCHFFASQIVRLHRVNNDMTAAAYSLSLSHSLSLSLSFSLVVTLSLLPLFSVAG